MNLLLYYLKELQLFIKNITQWVLLLLVFTAMFFTFPINNTLASQFFKHITLNLIPEGVTLIVTNPFVAFISQIKIALLLAFIVTLPFLLYKLIGYVFPALYAREKITIFKIAVPSALLFAFGALFAYFIVIPPTFDVLYSYTYSIGATAFFTVNEFINFVLALLFAVGFLFLLPVGMVLLSAFGVVPDGFWIKEWRYSFVFFLFISAIITPDGSGVTMILLSLPMAGLYMTGAIMSGKTRKRVESYQIESL